MKQIFFFCVTSFYCTFPCNVFAQSHSKDRQLTFITAVNDANKKFFIKADYVLLLSGNDAITVAKKMGEAEYDIKGKADTSWYVPNDFFILNNNPAIRQLQVSPTAQIFLIKTGTSALFKSSMYKLKNNFIGKLFRLTLMEHQIIKLEEIYLP